ncbi:MAG: glycosyltransferase, partial [Candidatus Omnitrophica bacterium]|nr:glycosyltransferase [Candidatus Omnitrophota bacterium]
LIHFKFSLPLMRALKRNIPLFDVVHIHSLFQFSTLAASYYSRIFNKPYIIGPLGQLDPFLLRRHFLSKWLYIELFERRNLEGASFVHFTSEEERNWCRQLNWKVSEIIVPLGVDLEEFNNLPSYGTFRLKYPKLEGKRIILFLSRIDFKKGLDILVKAFSNLAKQREDVYLVIVGPDNEGYAKKVKGWLSKNRLLRRTVFTGMLLGQDKLAAFRDSDVFVLPSYSENFGMAAVEAMACGVPVVISNKVGIHREVQKNKAGLVVECNAISLFEAIKSILDDKGFAEKISFNGINLVKEYYDINKVAVKMAKVYEDISKRGK